MLQIMALIDGSVYGQSVCDTASWIAKRDHAAVRLIHVLGRRNTSRSPVNLSGAIGLGARTSLLDELAAHDEERARLAQKSGRAILDDAKTRMIAAGIDHVTAQLRNGDVVETVQELEDEVGVIIIGKRGQAADFAKNHLGSNMERVVRSSHKPVLVTSDSFSPIEKFLIAFDGGASAQKAVAHVAQNKVLRGLECHLLTVGAKTPANQKKLEGAAKTLKSAGYTVKSMIVEGQADEVISKTIESNDVDLLIMGAYGHSRIRNLVIGSTTTEMVRACKIPVLLFR